MNKKFIIEYVSSVAKEMDENIEILRAIEDAKLEIEAARCFFEYASEPTLVEVAIYTEEAAKKRYDYLLNLARKRDMRVSQEYILDRCTKVAQ